MKQIYLYVKIDLNNFAAFMDLFSIHSSKIDLNELNIGNAPKKFYSKLTVFMKAYNKPRRNNKKKKLILLHKRRIQLVYALDHFLNSKNFESENYPDHDCEILLSIIEENGGKYEIGKYGHAALTATIAAMEIQFQREGYWENLVKLGGEKLFYKLVDSNVRFISHQKKSLEEAAKIKREVKVKNARKELYTAYKEYYGALMFLENLFPKNETVKTTLRELKALTGEFNTKHKTHQATLKNKGKGEEL